ncbi:FHA domain-containing protein [Cellulomonas sp. SLBN-39]|uniref:FHA domain-containing protein n=1 Tax=Cellulomonas sp. SLBN-39 TaxID=2768446 RepID=UPI001154ED3F|nr:FHA domain-containing protein [Cellulomonas sp. SLBN-39]TQL02874.1 double zinc ribbon protein [Cellulomonas sp. SLBN-39]
MSTVVCPDGHVSASTDYCDVCGAPMPAGGAAPAAPAAASTTSGSPATCPHCGTPAAPGALFCEGCGYDFTTGATPVAGPTPLAPPTPLNPPTPLTPPSGTPGPAAPGPAAATTPPAPVPSPAPRVPGEDAWVAELWIDPDWYAEQQPEDPMPSVGLPVLVPLRERSVLVGRPSVSRNIRPQVDAGADSGVSRRHCQLNTDGSRWWVEDLQSSNGTYVARVGAPLPSTPIPPGQRHELQDGDRLYLGSWTRLVVRRALPGEA